MQRKSLVILLLLFVVVVTGGILLSQQFPVAKSPSVPEPAVSPTTGSAIADPVPVTPSPEPTVVAGNLSVCFFDVGHGDSILVQSPSGRTLLIDAGLEKAGPTVVADLNSRNVTSLDILLATHPHKDHIGGMQDIIQEFPVKRFIQSGIPGTSTLYRNLETTLTQDRIPVTNVTSGDTIAFDPDVSLMVLNPPSQPSDDINTNSIVLRMVYRNATFLFAGDATTDSEDAMLEAGYPLQADVLKVGHHGNSGSTSTRFLQAVRPQLAVIEAGNDTENNGKKNPSDKVLRRLTAENATVFRTDVNGTVCMETDGEVILVTEQDFPPAWFPVQAAGSAT